VTGSARTTPLALYARQYLPSDVVGFGLVRATPERALPGDLGAAFAEFDSLHATHTADAMPATLRARAAAVFSDQYGGWRAVLAPLALVGLLAGVPAVLFAVVTALAVLLAYLAYAHQPYWSVYYLELLPTISFVTAVGLHRALRWLAATMRGAALAPGAESLMAALVLVVSLQPTGREVAAYRRRIEHLTQYQRQFADALAALPDDKLLVFVSYGRTHPPHYSLVRNVADPMKARLITAYDLGPAANDSVVRAYPGRAVYVLDEGRRALQKIVIGR
jgi:hypothetical protein